MLKDYINCTDMGPLKRAAGGSGMALARGGGPPPGKNDLENAKKQVISVFEEHHER